MKIALSGILVTTLAWPLSALTIDDMVRHTLNTNPDMIRHYSDYNATLYDLDKAEAGYLPSLELRGGIGPEHTDKETYDNDLVRKEVSLTATENLFEGFLTRYDIVEQKARIESVRQSALQNANVLALRAVEVYLQVAKQKALLDLQRENIDTHERIYKMIREKTENGLGRRSDVEQTEARLALAYANYIAQLNNFQDALINFERVYGKGVSAGDIVVPTAPKLPGKTLASLEALALEYNPTLLIEQSNIAVRQAQLEKSRASFYPKVDAELSGELQEDIDGIEGKDNGYRAMLRLYYNLYNGGFDEATRLQSLQYVASQKAYFDEQLRAVNEKIRLSWSSDQIISKRLRCLRLHSDLSKKASESYAKEYQLGRRSLLDLLNVELEYNDARQAVVQAENELLYARYRLLENMGLLNYALQTGVLANVEASQPDTIAFTVAEPEALILFDDHQSACEYINKLCLEPQKEIRQEVIAADAVELLETETATPIVMENITFEYKSAALTEATKVYLQQVVDLLQRYPDSTLEIYAHTDDIGSYVYNRALSERRAISVKQALVEAGISPLRLSALGKGETSPVASNATEEGRAQNRRVEFVFHKEAPQPEAYAFDSIDDRTLLDASMSREYVTFNYRSTDVSEVGRRYLDKVSEFLKANPALLVEIQAYTDSIGSNKFNQELSKARADSVRETLVGFGVDSNRLNAVGKGEADPIADNGTSLGRSQNRRVEFVVNEHE